EQVRGCGFVTGRDEHGRLRQRETGGLAEVGVSFLAPDAGHELPSPLDVADPGGHESTLRRAHQLELENAGGLEAVHDGWHGADHGVDLAQRPAGLEAGALD